MAKMSPVKSASKQTNKQASKQAATNYQAAFTYGTPEEFLGGEREQVSRQASKQANGHKLSNSLYLRDSR